MKLYTTRHFDTKFDETPKVHTLIRGGGSEWAGWAITHPDFSRIEKRTETQIDTLLLFTYPKFSCFRLTKFIF